MDKLHIDCEHLVAIPAGVRMVQHVIFRPALKTTLDVQEAVRTNACVQLHVSDVSGESESKRLNVCVGAITEHGTIILTTKEL